MKVGLQFETSYTQHRFGNCGEDWQVPAAVVSAPRPAVPVATGASERQAMARTKAAQIVAPPRPLPVNPTYRATSASFIEVTECHVEDAKHFRPVAERSVEPSPGEYLRRSSPFSPRLQRKSSQTSTFAAQAPASPCSSGREIIWPGVTVSPATTRQTAFGSGRDMTAAKTDGHVYGRTACTSAGPSRRGQGDSFVGRPLWDDGRSRQPAVPSTPSFRSFDRDSDASAPRTRVRSTDIGGPRNSVLRQAPVAITERAGPHRRNAKDSVTASRSEATVVDDEAAEYSDRFLPGYERGRLLGRGACAVVWLAQGPSGFVAVKQAAKGTTGKKRSDTEAAKKEIFFGSVLFGEGEAKEELLGHEGTRHITKLLDFFETKRDVWLVMEYGGTSLTKMAYEIKGEFLRGERLYRVNHLPLLQSMKSNTGVFTELLRQLLSALCLLADLGIVHSDIKPDNILVDEDEHGQLRARLIDLGSAFNFSSPESLALATPEYMPPEALETCASNRASLLGGLAVHLGGRGERPSGIAARLVGSSALGSRRTQDTSGLAQKFQPSTSQPWSFDVWSLGSIVLELACGMPLWLSYKCRVAEDQRANSAATGLFAVPGRDPEKILVKQADVLKQRGLANVLRAVAGIPLGEGPQSGLGLLSLMLEWEPMERISPHEALRHPWLQG